MDDLEDMLADGNVGGPKGIKPRAAAAPKTQMKPSVLDELDDLDGFEGGERENFEGGESEDDLDDLWGGPKQAKPVSSQKRRVPSANQQQRFDASLGRGGPSPIRGPSRKGVQANDNAGLSDVENFLCEAYNLILRDQFLGFPVTMANIFNN